MQPCNMHRQHLAQPLSMFAYICNWITYTVLVFNWHSDNASALSLAHCWPMFRPAQMRDWSVKTTAALALAAGAAGGAAAVEVGASVLASAFITPSLPADSCRTRQTHWQAQTICCSSKPYRNVNSMADRILDDEGGEVNATTAGCMIP